MTLNPGGAVLKAVALRLAAFDLVELAMFVRKLDQATAGSGGGGGSRAGRSGGGAASRGVATATQAAPAAVAMAQQDSVGAGTLTTTLSRSGAPAAESDPSWLLGLKRTAKRLFAAKA